jgi:hypothetical protein
MGSKRKTAAFILALCLVLPALLVALPAQAVEDPPLTITVTDPSQVEGQTLTFTISLVTNAPAACANDGVTIDYNTESEAGTASPNDDYTPISGTTTLFIEPGTSEVQVPVADDNDVETDETVILTLTEAASETCSTDDLAIVSPGTGTILDDENTAPDAVDDEVSTFVDTALDIFVLDNDFDPDDDCIGIVMPLSDPPNGSAGVSGDGCWGEYIHYTPNSGFEGVDSFTYTISDGSQTDSATVTVTVAQDAPPVAVDDAQTTTVNTQVEIDVLANDSNDGGCLDITDVSDPPDGSAEITSGAGCWDEQVNYTPGQNFEGTDTFTYTVADDGGQTDNATVTMTVESCPELAPAIDDGGVVVGEGWEICSATDANAVSSIENAVMTPVGGTFGLMTSGDSSLASPNTEDGGAGRSNQTSARGANDVSILRLDINVPEGANCLSLDVAFMSEEYPEFVGSAFNDGFIAELDTSTWVVDGESITADDNFAFDTTGNIISINSPFFSTENVVEATGTEYDGSTPLLIARTPVTPGAHSLFLSIFDASDHVLDSAAFVDGLSAGAAAPGECVAGAKIATEVPNLTDAVDDQTTTARNTPVTLDVLANDSGGACPTIENVTDPANGTSDFASVGCNADTVTYTPDLDFIGIDTFDYTISNGDQTDTATVTVDVVPLISVVDFAPVQEGDSGQTEAFVIFTIDSIENLDNYEGGSVAVTTEDGTALVGFDYEEFSNSSFPLPEPPPLVCHLACPPPLPLTNAPLWFLSVPVLGDTIDEVDETFSVVLSDPQGVAIEDGEATITILDDDLPTPHVSINDVSVTEGDSGTTAMNFTVSVDTLEFDTIFVDYASSDGTATAPGDYAAVANQSVTFVGDLSGCEFCDKSQTKTVTVEVNGDTADEPDETFFVDLVGIDGGQTTDARGVGTILNDDAPPALSIADGQTVEGNSGTQFLELDIAMNSFDNFNGGSVLVETSDGTATAGSDYGAVSETLFVPPPPDLICIFECLIGPPVFTNPVFSSVFIPIHGDVIDEADETFAVTLSEPDGLTIADGEATVTIVDDDVPPPPPPVPLVSIGDATITEGNSGNTDATFTVSLSVPTTVAVSLNYATAGNTAAEGIDYASAAGAISFLPGETTKTVSVPVVGDTLDENDESFSVALGGVVGGTIGDGTGMGTIVDDDDPPVVSIADLAIAEGHSGAVDAAFSVNLDAPSALPVSLDFATSDGSATDPDDYRAGAGSVGFAPGETTDSVVVRVRGDELDEVNETFFVDLVLGPDANAIAGDVHGVGTILDDDEPPCVVDCEPDEPEEDDDEVGGTRIFRPDEDDGTGASQTDAATTEGATDQTPVAEVPTEDGDEGVAPEIGFDKPSIAPGEDLTVSGAGCVPGEKVVLAIDGTNLAVTKADGQGAFQITAPTPGDLPVGRHSLVATCGDQSVDSPLDVVLTSSVQGIGGAPAAIITVFGLFLFFILQGRELFEHERGEGRHRIAVAGVDGALDGLDQAIAAPARVLVTRSMSWGFVAAAVALFGLAGVIGLVGLDAPDRSASVGTGQVFIAGQDLAADEVIAIDAGEPVAITIGDQASAAIGRADSVRLALGVAGIDLTADQTSLVEEDGELGAEVDLSNRDFLVAGHVGGELQLLADGEVISTHEFDAKSDESVYLSAPGEFTAGLLLFALAGAEILLRQMRRGRRRRAGIVGLAGLGVVAGFALGAIAALVAGQEPTVLVMVVTAMLGAIAGVVAGLGAQRAQGSRS